MTNKQIESKTLGRHKGCSQKMLDSDRRWTFVNYEEHNRGSKAPSPSTQLQCITITLSASLEHHRCFGILKNVLKYRGLSTKY